MKTNDLLVKFNNVWDDFGDGDAFELWIFHIPVDLDIDIKKEVDILYNCQMVFEDCDFDDVNAVNEYCKENNISLKDIEFAKAALDFDGENCSGVTTSRFSTFISIKYPDITYECYNASYDVEIDLD